MPVIQGFPTLMTLTVEENLESEVSVRPAASERARRWRSRLRNRWNIWALILITLFGGVLRFWKIDQPPIWGDEAATYSRICGTYQDLIDILQFNGFVPLHYELYQWIERGMPMWARIDQGPIKPVQKQHYFSEEEPAPPVKPGEKVPTKPILVGEHPLIAGGVTMTPFVMRLVPALAGVAMIPAMYFLVVQITRKEVALIAALFTATSAYMLIYSRDAKMYMHFWLFCTLSVACLLWWLRARTRISWLCWVAASCAMCGLHAPGAILLGVELLIFLSRDRQWWIPGLIMLGGFVAGSALGGTTNFFGAIVDARWIMMGFGLVLGLFAYIAQRRRDWLPSVFFLVGLAVILSGIGGYYLKFNRFKEQIDQGDWRGDSMLGWIDPYNRGRDGADLVRYAGSAFLSAWEWTMPSQEPNVDPRALALLHGSLETICVVLLVGLIPWRRRSMVTVRQCSPQDEVTTPLGGRSETSRFFWIAAWLVVPVYAFYCVSAQRDPQDGLAPAFANPFGGRHVNHAAVIPPAWQPAFVSPNQWFIDSWHWLLSENWKIWLMLIAIIVIGTILCARSWRGRLINIVSLLGSLAILYALLLGTFLLMRELNHRAFLQGQIWHSLWIPRYLGFAWPAMATAVAALLWRLPTKPIRYGAIALLVALNLSQFCARLHTGEPPTDLICRDIMNAQPGSPTRTYLSPNLRESIGARPGEGLVDSQAWRYYLAVDSHTNITPFEFRSFNGRQRFFFELHVISVLAPLYIQIDVNKNPKVNRIVTWEKIEPHLPDPDQVDPVAPQLGAAWKRTSEQIFSGYDHWTWQQLYRVRRREYVRVSR